jgi:NADPH:quinone reductase-like Zn-dependent oxidoreductase
MRGSNRFFRTKLRFNASQKVQEIRRLTSDVVDFVFDPIGGPYLGHGAIFELYIAGGWLLPGRSRVVPYSIQTLKRAKPEYFREDLIALLELLQQKKIKPLIAQQFPLAEARHSQELLARGGVTGKIVLVRNGPSFESGAA